MSKDKCSVDVKRTGKVCEALEKEPVVKGIPLSNNFYLIPRQAPHLREFVEYVNWSATSKSLEIGIKETPCFTAFKWFNTINARAQQAFHDPEMDNLTLCCLDKSDNEIFRLRFKYLSLESHSSSFLNQGAPLGIDAENPMIHNIVISYREIEEVPAPDDNYPNTDPQELADEEWSVKRSEVVVDEPEKKEE